MTRPSLPAQAELPIARYLDQVDIALPGFVEGLYVVGSLALGAWQDGPSDIDALILTSRPAGAAEVAALAKIHEGMAARPYLDVVYLDPDTLAAQPMDM